MRTLTTTAEIIDALGGTQAVAALFNCDARTVSFWRVNGRLPAKTYLAIISELTMRGLAAPASLWSFTTISEAAQ